MTEKKRQKIAELEAGKLVRMRITEPRLKRRSKRPGAKNHEPRFRGTREERSRTHYSRW